MVSGRFTASDLNACVFGEFCLLPSLQSVEKFRKDSGTLNGKAPQSIGTFQCAFIVLLPHVR